MRGEGRGKNRRARTGCVRHVLLTGFRSLGPHPSPLAPPARYHAFIASVQDRKDRPMSDMKIGKFQIVGTLGTGAHSTTLHIRRSADGKNYVLKVVPISEPEDQKYLDQAEHEYR